MIYAVLALSLTAIAQTWLLLRVNRRLGRLAHIDDRLRRLSDATVLLADTTEAGLTSLATEVSRQTVKRRPSPRQAASKRIVAAARDGNPITTIAQRESLSEGEIRLHLALAEDLDQPEAADAGR